MREAARAVTAAIPAGAAAVASALLLGALLAAPIAAQDRPIQDNSFLVEEAYNQEAGVVQHVSTLLLPEDGGSWAYAFTQEWPAAGLEHQVSYTVPIERSGEARQEGLGDIAVHYRYQAVGDADAPLAFAPRLSVLLPTGDPADGLGLGAAGLEVNLPLSAVLHPALVGHWNAGAAYVPDAENRQGAEADVASYRLAQGLVWLARPRLNVLLEALWESAETVIGPGATEREESAFISPGVRVARDFASGLQIVAGIGLPIGLGPSSDERAALLYLSFEHRFGRR